MSEFYNPYGEDSPEQIAYQQEILNQSFRHNEEQGDAQDDEYTTDRSIGSGSSHRRVGSLGKTVFGIVKDVGGSLQNASKFFKVDAQLKKDIYDPNLFPEVAHQAYVRRGLDLSPEETAYLSARKARVRDQFARFMGWDPAQVHPDDVPTVAFGGSGGGYRAMLAMLGYSTAMKQAGLWDMLTYVSGVSGSCWAIAAYYTLGHGNMDKVIDHCKKRLSPLHPLSPEAVKKTLSVPRGDYETLGPLIQKHKSGLMTVPMDLYAVFSTGYLFYQEDPMINPMGTAEAEIPGYHRAWWKWTEAQAFLINGAEPLPILTAIRHERPWRQWADPEHPFRDNDPTSKEHRDADDAWWQWFELSPYEVGCDELQAWCPTWAFGRQFEEGKSVTGLPEQSLSLLLGLCTSAPAGPLSSYLATIQRNLPQGFIGDTINNIASSVTKMWGKKDTAIFENHHPLHASNEYNFLFHLTPAQKGVPRPPGIQNSPRIHLIDSGMDNNCPTYVMLHPERRVDVILNMDASSDVQKDSFQQRASQIGYRRGLDFRRRRDVKPDPDTANPDRFKGLYGQIYDGALMQQRPATVVDSYGHTVMNPPAPACRQGCTMVYMPLLPNERAVPGYDPSTAKFSGSYNLVWTPEQVDMIIKTSVANYYEAQETIREALYNAWQRKKQLREQGWTAQAQAQVQAQVQAPATPHVPPEVQIHSQTQLQPGAQFQPQSQGQPQPQYRPQSQGQPQSPSQPQLRPPSQDQYQAQSQGRLSPQFQPQAHYQPQSQSQTQGQAQPPAQAPGQPPQALQTPQTFRIPSPPPSTF